MRSFHNSCLYVICSGQNGYTVSEFAIQKISAEILFGELNNCAPDKVKDVLRYYIPFSNFYFYFYHRESDYIHLLI